MKQRLLLGLLFNALSFGVIAQAQVRHIETNITLRNEKGAYATVICGLDSVATSGIDASLGEFALPGFPPTPSGLQAAYAYKDNGQTVLSYKDLKPFKKGRIFQDTSTIVLTPATDDSRGLVLSFTWSYPLDRNIDSIVISDLFGGLVKRIVLDRREADTLKNQEMNLENFYVITYYHIKDAVSVDDDKDVEQPFVQYLTDDKILLPLEFQYPTNSYNYRILNLRGQVVGDGILSDRMYDVSALARGVYFMEINSTSGSSKRINFVRF